MWCNNIRLYVTKDRGVSVVISRYGTELNNVINHEEKPSCLCKVYHDAELSVRNVCIEMLLLHQSLIVVFTTTNGGIPVVISLQNIPQVV